MSGFFQSEVDEIKQILDIIKDFLISNNNNVRPTESFVYLENKTFLQAIEETLNDPNVNIEEKSKHLELLKLFLEKLKKIYSSIILSYNSDALEMKIRIEENSVFLGFSGNNDNDIFSELENTVNRLDKREILL